MGEKLRSLSKVGIRWLPLFVIAGLFVQTALGQGGAFQTTNPDDILQQFRDQRALWTANIFVYANALFGILAVIEFAWSAAVMLLEKSDLQSWTSALIRKLMWIGAFYALLINGRTWIPAIIDSFNQIGANAAGMGGPLSPGNVFAQGLSIAGALIDAGSTSAFFTNPGTSLSLILCAVLIVVSYIFITVNFVVTIVESYIVVSVGFIFLGFGGSRWTVPYTERYIGLAISIGIKIVLLYCLITAGLNLGVGWINEADSVGTAPHPNMVAFDVMGAALIFMMCCWQIPKLFAAVVGGAPALAGGDLWGTGMAVLGSGVAVASLGATAITGAAGASVAVAGTGSAASTGGSGPGAASVVAGVGPGGFAGGTGASVPPPNGASRGPSGSEASSRRQPDPPSRTSVGGSDFDPGISRDSVFQGTSTLEDLASAGLATIGGESLSGSGFEAEPVARGFKPSSVSVGSQSSSLTAETGEPAPTAALPPSASDVGSVGAVGSFVPQPPAQERRERLGTVANSVSDFLRGALRRYNSLHFGSGKLRLPSDSAPHQSPPRMPVEHEE